MECKQTGTGLERRGGSVCEGKWYLPEGQAMKGARFSLRGGDRTGR